MTGMASNLREIHAVCTQKHGKGGKKLGGCLFFGGEVCKWNLVWSMSMSPQKNKNGRGEKKLQGKSLCVWNLVFLKTNPTLPWELVTAFHGSTSFSKGKFYRVDFWKNTFQATKNPPWRASMKTNGFCLPILEKPNKIQRNPWIGTYYLTDSHGNPFLGTTLFGWCFCSAA